ncbi:hypothetical protein BX600DRAFT_415269 [Xylariales sp. PMI_506]|nr:hypothetical protein BX600DRAFT_415269 [Xylariales sp. PMI_506]
MSKSVCVVGAGPAGLVAAKTLLHDAPDGIKFEVTIFEAQKRIGGLWPSGKDDDSGLLHPLMATNQSRHTMQFSDLAWPQDAPQLPRAWQVGGYLELYRQRYCEGVKLRTTCRVEKAELGSDSWTVQVRSAADNGIEEHKFDYLLVASGFFGQAVVPRFVRGRQFDIPVIHSSKYRDLKSLLGDPTGKSGKILVVGGQMSGVEISGTIASHVSALTNLPVSLSNDGEERGRLSVHHIIQRPSWLIPLLTTPKPGSKAPPFMPLDLATYNLSNRPLPLENTQHHVPVEMARQLNAIFRASLGTDQSNFSSLLSIKEDDYDDVPFITVNDPYTEFVRSGAIELSRGKLEEICGSTAIISPSGTKIENVVAVVLATGFDASSSLSYLPEYIRKLVSVNACDINNPVALGFHAAHHPEIERLGFVGFYRSPYWGVMEMQSRFLTALWGAGGSSSPTLPPALAAALKADTTITRTLALRDNPRAAQFPMGDYLWVMDQFATALEIERVPHLEPMPVLPLTNREMDILTPARYPGKNLSADRREQVEASLRQTEATVWKGVRDNGFIARAVFRSLLGEWKLDRHCFTDEGGRDHRPSALFTGTATFLMRANTLTDKKQEAEDGLEYIYKEKGVFTDPTTGEQSEASKTYIWRYSQIEDKLSIWQDKVAVNSRDGEHSSHFLHEIKFLPVEQDDETIGWRAKAVNVTGLAEQINYRFAFDAVNLTHWSSENIREVLKSNVTVQSIFKR